MLKSDLRKRMKRVRAEVSPEEARAAEQAVWRFLGELDGPVLVYVSIGSELPTRRLIAWMLEAGMQLAVPRLTSKTMMEAARLESLDQLVPGGFRVPTSEGPVVEPEHVLVPGLAFDAHGGRIGYGAGYYDRWLALHPARSIGLGFACQLVERVPVENHDRPLDRVLTEAGWAR